MARRQAAATEQAVRAYLPGTNVYALAKKFRISASNLYRALKDEGYKFRRGNHK